MVNKYDLKTAEDYQNVIKEIIQEIVLSGLARANFYDKGVFYGGSALRILHQLNRFSEDIDLSLIAPDSLFDFNMYLQVVKKELFSFGLTVEVVEKVKMAPTNIRSAFIKSDATTLYLEVFDKNDLMVNQANQKVKVKIEIDTNPPKYATYESHYLLFPYPYSLKAYDLPSMFAGKIHALLCRPWQNRVKGRDLFDYVYFISKNVTLNLNHLQARLVQSKILNDDTEFNIVILQSMLIEKFKTIDFQKAKNDILPFIKNYQEIEIYSTQFFIEITRKLK